MVSPRNADDLAQALEELRRAAEQVDALAGRIDTDLAKAEREGRTQAGRSAG